MKDGNKKLIFILAFILLCGAAGAVLLIGRKPTDKDENNIEAHLELGQKYISEMQYEAAVAEYLQVITIDPYHAEANRALLGAAVAIQDYANAIGAAERMAAISAELTDEELILAQEAYEEAGRGEEILGFYSMLYHTNPTDQIIECLIQIQAENHNFSALGNIVADIKNRGIASEKYISDVLNTYIRQNDNDAIDDLLAICEKNDISNKIPKSYRLYEMLEKDTPIEEILAYLDENEDIMEITENMGEDKTFYIGVCDEAGIANGKGICYYGSDKYRNTRLYIGDFVDGERNGNGVAYSNKGYYIICEWQNDLPNGHAEKYMYSDYSIGSLSNGHISEPTTMYDLSGNIIYICGIPDTRFESGYAYAYQGDYSDLDDDPCPAAHVYCWDCMMAVEEGL